MDKAGRGQRGAELGEEVESSVLEVSADADVNKTDSIFVALLLFCHAENSDLTSLSQHQILTVND